MVTRVGMKKILFPFFIFIFLYVLTGKYCVVRPVLICAVFLGLLSQVPASSEEQKPLTLQDISILLDYLQNKEFNGSENRLNEINNSYDAEDETEEETKSTEKRAKMALCHFKICNMGRKRTYSDLFRTRKMWPWF